jgi:hypothetical protein
MEKNLIIKSKEIEFDYSDVDQETSYVMKKAVEKMLMVTKNTKMVIGEELCKVQEKLAGNNQYDGYFGKWYSALGLKKDFVYDCINYYKLLIANSENQMLQELSYSKVCEISKIKDNVELQREVINTAPLDKMKVKQIHQLVKEVNTKKEITKDMINEIIQTEVNSNSKVKEFVKVTNDFIEIVENKNQEMTQEEIDSVLTLINRLNELSQKVKENS